MADTSIVRLSARVHGRVQGVGFRYQARSVARRLDVSGYVRNRFDGSVEVEAEGPREKVEQFHRWLEKGPPGARVTKVDATEGPPRGYASFTVEF
ncbi:MAG: acylphosphatase [Spirochaetota bacterium]